MPGQTTAFCGVRMAVGELSKNVMEQQQYSGMVVVVRRTWSSGAPLWGLGHPSLLLAERLAELSFTEKGEHSVLGVILEGREGAVLERRSGDTGL